MRSLKAHIWGNERHRFLIVGAYNTGFGYLIFVFLYEAFGKSLHYLVIVFLSHIIAVTNAFLAQRRLVFRTKGSVFAEFVRFNVTTIGTLLIGLTGMTLLVEQFKLPVLLAQALVTGVTVVASYFAHKYFTFKKPSAENLISKISSNSTRIIRVDGQVIGELQTTKSSISYSKAVVIALIMSIFIAVGAIEFSRLPIKYRFSAHVSNFIKQLTSVDL